MTLLSSHLLKLWESYPWLWNKIFLVLCVIGVSIDPLFLYIPIVNDDKKCLEIDHRMKIVLLVLRSITDLAYISPLIFRLRSTLKMSRELGLSIFTGLPWSYVMLNVLPILPVPQLVVLVLLSKMEGRKSLTFISLVLPLQYVSRIIRFYLSAKQLHQSTIDSLTRSALRVRGAAFFLLYLISGHVFGAFWYFYSIVREMKCWHLACESSSVGCNISSLFDCSGNTPMKNLTYLNEFCPVNPPNSAVFNFGIFAEAIELGILGKTSFLVKFTHSFWWGLRNLSSFGSNLITSRDPEENLFAILLSSLSLLLSVYLIGYYLQKYMQLATTKAEEARRKISIKEPEIDSYLSNLGLPAQKKLIIMRYLKRKIEEDTDFDVKYLFSLLGEHADIRQQKSETFAAWVTKILDEKTLERTTTEQKAELWISKNRITYDIRPKLMRYVRLRLQEGKDVDLACLLHILPFSFGMSIKRDICLPMLLKVPLFQNMDELVFETICKLLKPVIYSEKSYIIRKGEPLDMMLFITQGVVWTFGSNTSPMECLQKGDYYGNNLIEWRLSSTSYAEFPISTANLKSHTKVEALALMAIDLEHMLSRCWFKFSKFSTDASIYEGLKHFAAAYLQRGFRHYISRRRTFSINIY